MAACVHIFGVIFYGLFASAEKQYWAEPHEDMIRLYEDEDGFGSEESKPLNHHENYGATNQVISMYIRPKFSIPYQLFWLSTFFMSRFVSFLTVADWSTQVIKW